jgi:hypothetical protein
MVAVRRIKAATTGPDPEGMISVIHILYAMHGTAIRRTRGR